MRPAPILLLLLLAGCAAGPNYSPPTLDIAPAWRSAPATERSDGPWWQAFNDPILNQLEAEALTANLDLDQALARVQQARGALKGATAALLPSGEIDAAYAKVEQSLNSGLGQLSRYVPNFPRTVDNAQATASAGWELDFAGGLRRQREAAKAGLQGQVDSYEAARIALSAEVADAYIALRGAQGQRTDLGKLIVMAEDLRSIAAARVRTGEYPAQELPRTTALVADLMAQAPLLDAQVEAERNRLSVLLARDPSRALPELAAEGALPMAPDPAAGLPADVLRQRPDVRVAEQRLVAANAGIGAALAEYYPKVSLSGLVGQVSNRFATLSSGDASEAQGVVGLRWRLFDFVRIDADVRQARGREREARAAYRQSVLLAAESVETSFAELAAARARVARLRSEREALVTLQTAAWRAVAVGQVPRESVVLAEQAVGRLDLDLLAADRDAARAVIACDRALGASTATPSSAPRKP